MAGSTAKKKFLITTAQGTEVEVTATRAEEDNSGTIIRLYDGEDLVGSFRSYGSFRVVPAGE